MLRHVLDEGRTLGLEGVALTVEGENPGSVRLIEVRGDEVLAVFASARGALRAAAALQTRGVQESVPRESHL